MRRYLTPKERRDMLEAQHRQCALCGGGITLRDCIAEHFLPVALGNDQKPDGLVCGPCALRKTSADIARISKANRQRKAHLGLKRRRGRKLQSRGFQPKPEGFVYRWNNAKTFLGARNG